MRGTKHAARAHIHLASYPSVRWLCWCSTDVVLKLANAIVAKLLSGQPVLMAGRAWRECLDNVVCDSVRILNVIWIHDEEEERAFIKTRRRLLPGPNG